MMMTYFAGVAFLILTGLHIALMLFKVKRAGLIHQLGPIGVGEQWRQLVWAMIWVHGVMALMGLHATGLLGWMGPFLYVAGWLIVLAQAWATWRSYQQSMKLFGLDRDLGNITD